jgi:AraC-like ligand binding domain
MTRLSHIHRASLADFRTRHLLHPEVLPPLYQEAFNSSDPAHFSVYSRAAQPCQRETGPVRQDFYKISFVAAGTGRFTYGARQYDIRPGALVFTNLQEVRTWQATSAEQDGFYCVFNEAFLAQPAHSLQQLRQYPHFQMGAATAVLQLAPAQAAVVSRLTSMGQKTGTGMNEQASWRALRGGCFGGLAVRVAPGFQAFPGGRQGVAAGRQLVLDAWGHFGKHGAGNQAVVFQLAELQRQHAVGDVRQRLFQLAKAVLPLLQLIEYQQLPAAAQQVHGVDHAAVVAEHFAVAAVGGGGFPSGHYFLFC